MHPVAKVALGTIALVTATAAFVLVGTTASVARLAAGLFCTIACAALCFIPLVGIFAFGGVIYGLGATFFAIPVGVGNGVQTASWVFHKIF